MTLLLMLLLLLLLLLLSVGTVATNHNEQNQCTLCVGHSMVAGMQYAELTILKEGRSGAYFGVSGGSIDTPTPAWLLATCLGSLFCRHELADAATNGDWEGRPSYGEIKQGDVIGLLLDLGQCTLSVRLNSSWRGVMVAPGMKDWDGAEVPRLAGPLRWAVSVGHGASVRIERRPLPPSLQRPSLSA
jgi:hypothetical protein